MLFKNKICKSKYPKIKDTTLKGKAPGNVFLNFRDALFTVGKKNAEPSYNIPLALALYKACASRGCPPAVEIAAIDAIIEQGNQGIA